MVTPTTLNARQKQFAVEYARLGNATQAAINAGYAYKTATSRGYKMLENTGIQQAIADEKAIQAKKNDVTIEELVNMHREAYRVAEEVKAPNAMTAAAQNLAKLMGLITDKGQIEHSGGLIVNVTKFSDGDLN
jgi:phage terminase small subunit